MRYQEKKIKPGQYDENIFNVASQMIHKIEQRIAHTLPDDEVWFIYQYIISSGVAIDGQKRC